MPSWRRSASAASSASSSRSPGMKRLTALRNTGNRVAFSRIHRFSDAASSTLRTGCMCMAFLTRRP